MAEKQNAPSSAADLDLLLDTDLSPLLDMSSFLNEPSTLDPAFDDLTSWASLIDGLQGAQAPASTQVPSRPTPGSSCEPSTGPSTPGLGPSQTHTPAAKVANRFSSESVRLLRQWLKDHESHPYASAHDVEVLQGRTGLTKQQVNNWLSNARRRYKFHTPPASTRIGRSLPETSSSAEHPPVAVPRRRPTPIPFEAMNPLERWESSPPEHEAASVLDISRVVAATPASPSVPYYLRGSDVSSSDASSVSSAGISRSSRGSGSSNHTDSLSLAKSLGNLNASRKKRRKASKRHMARRTNLMQPCHTYQCTFCIETFKHKYDWQRHEKSLHLSLEEWICTPTGPTIFSQDLGLDVCVYCGEAEPQEAHLETHHHSVCQERAPEHRTFYRKDHLRQHLKLVHEVNFVSWPMDQWKTRSREIKSRCGFCNQQLDTWTNRTDHLAQHFKSGYTMAEWKGDWGFDGEVLGMVDNAMPPYLIHYERMSPLPISSVRGSPDTPASAYELIKLELEFFTQECLGTRGMLPMDSELQYEGCCVIYGADTQSAGPEPSPSWLRDAFLCTDKEKEARLLPLPQNIRSRVSQLKINGKKDIFDDCDLEVELCRIVSMHSAVGADMSDYEVQEEAANILAFLEACSPRPSKHFADFFLRLIWGSTEWLQLFRQRRESLFRKAKGKGPDQASQVTAGLDGTYQQFMPHLFPTPLCPGHQTQEALGSMALAGTELGGTTSLATIKDSAGAPPSASDAESGQLYRAGAPFLLNDHNSYTRLAAGLARFVTTTMSPNNPNRHVPTDEELQYQARWMWYNE